MYTRAVGCTMTKAVPGTGQLLVGVQRLLVPQCSIFAQGREYYAFEEAQVACVVCDVKPRCAGQCPTNCWSTSVRSAG